MKKQSTKLTLNWISFLANSGAAAGGILFMVSYIPYTFLLNSYESLSFGAKFLPSLLHNTALGMGCIQISLFEGTGQFTCFIY